MSKPSSNTSIITFSCTSILMLSSACVANVAGEQGDHHTTTPHDATGDGLASLALANVQGTACGTNSLGGTGFDSSCTGNGGQPGGTGAPTS